MNSRLLTAILLSTLVAAGPLVAQSTSNDAPIIVPVERVGENTNSVAGMGGFTPEQGLIAAGVILTLGIAVAAGGNNDSSSGSR